jgi:GNAT superfamily N-acetyltransferase
MLDRINFSVIETLRNGKEIEIRAQRPQDRNDLEAAILRMSDESLYRRFFGAKRHFSDREADYFLNIDFVSHAALVAVAHENSKPAIVGAGRYVVVEPGAAEVAFGVIDEYQGQGIGAAAT